MDFFYWFLAGLSLVGVVLNIQKNSTGFVIWMFTNCSWSIIDFSHGLPAQGSLFAVYFILAVWGWLKWSGNIKERIIERRGYHL